MENKLKVTWGLALKIWWSWLWRAMLWGILFGLIAGGFAGLFSAFTNISDGETLGTIAGYIVYFPVSLWCLKTVLTKKFNEYQIIVVPNND